MLKLDTLDGRKGRQEGLPEFRRTASEGDGPWTFFEWSDAGQPFKRVASAVGGRCPQRNRKTAPQNDRANDSRLRHLLGISKGVFGRSSPTHAIESGRRTQMRPLVSANLLPQLLQHLCFVIVEE